MTKNLPSIKDLSALLIALKRTIRDDYRYQGFEKSDYEEGDRKVGGLPGLPSMTVTIGWDGYSSAFGWQTGDNSYTGGAYGYASWAVVDIDRRSDTRAVAREIRRQLTDIGSEWD